MPDNMNDQDSHGAGRASEPTVQSAELATMFADVSGSTRLYDELGDEAALERISHCLNLASRLTRTYDGRVIKTIGDEVLCVFRSVNDAIAAACAIQTALAGPEGVNDGSGKRLAMRVGVHFGPAILDDGDVFGDAVNVAARMTSQAKANQVIVSGATRADMSPILRSCTRYVDRATVKGKAEPMEMYEFVCHPDDATVMAELTMPGTSGGPCTMTLEGARGTVQVSEQRPTVLIGRDASCDLVVDELTASRQHLRIEYRKNRFYVVDQSTNGTHIRPDMSDAVFTRREELLLEGSGLINLGCSFKRRPEGMVRFRIRETGEG